MIEDWTDEKDYLMKGFLMRVNAEPLPDGFVKVWFRDVVGKEHPFVMHRETYEAVPLNIPATLQTYKKKGPVEVFKQKGFAHFDIIRE